MIIAGERNNLIRREVIRLNREEAFRAIAKVFAYLNCGKPEKAREWALKLIEWLETI